MNGEKQGHEVGAAATAAAGAVSNTRHQRYVLAVLTSVYTLNLADRGLIMILAQPIKEDLALSDTQLGLLTGIAFGFFYAVLGVPIARWADRGDRVTITSLAIGLWGLTVMACLLITSYVQLIFARVAAAVGEAGCKPATYSLLGDYYRDPSERTHAMAIYLSGNYLAALFAFVVGGWLNEAYGWRTAFFLTGIPGLLLAVLVRMTLSDPRSRGLETEVRPQSVPAMSAVFKILWYRKSCRNLCLALIAFYTMGLGLGPWKAAFMIRSHGMGTAELGIWMGSISGLCGIAGLLLGAQVATRWFAGDERAQTRMSAVAVGFIAPCFAAFLLLPGKHQALLALIPLQIVFSLFLGPTYVLLQRLVPDEMRATMMAVVMMLANLIGFGIGPQFVGVASDWLAPLVGLDSLRYSMLMMSCVALVGAHFFWRAGRTIRADIAMARRGAQ